MALRELGHVHAHLRLLHHELAGAAQLQDVRAYVGRNSTRQLFCNRFRMGFFMIFHDFSMFHPKCEHDSTTLTECQKKYVDFDMFVCYIPVKFGNG